LEKGEGFIEITGYRFNQLWKFVHRWNRNSIAC